MPESTTKVITVSYDSSGVSVNPRVLDVMAGDKLQFQRVGEDAAVLLQIIFSNHDGLSTGVYTEGDPDVEVLSPLANEIPFACQLISKDGSSSADVNSSQVAGGVLRPVPDANPIPAVVVVGTIVRGGDD